MNKYLSFRYDGIRLTSPCVQDLGRIKSTSEDCLYVWCGKLTSALLIAPLIYHLQYLHSEGSNRDEVTFVRIYLGLSALFCAAVHAILTSSRHRCTGERSRRDPQPRRDLMDQRLQARKRSPWLQLSTGSDVGVPQTRRARGQRQLWRQGSHHGTQYAHFTSANAQDLTSRLERSLNPNRVLQGQRCVCHPRRPIIRG